MSSVPVHSRPPTRRWLLGAMLALSCALHVGLAWFVSVLFEAPDLGIEFQVPIDVELGLSEAVAAAPVVPPAPVAATQAKRPASDAPLPDEEEKKSEDGAKPSREKPPVEDAGREAGDDKQHGADAGAPRPAPGTDVEGQGSGLPPGAQIAVRVDMERIRKSPLAADIRALVSAIPDWKALLDGSGIDPVDMLDRLIIATPNLQRSHIVLAGRFVGHAAVVDAAVQRLASARGAKAEWRTDAGVRIAPWVNTDNTPRVIALVGPSHFTISREEDLPRILAIASARVRDKAADGDVEEHPADALLSMQRDEGLSLEVEGVTQFVKRAKRGVPLRLRLSAVEIPGPKVELRGRMEFEDSDKAADAARFWTAARDSYARNGLVVLLGLAGPLREGVIEQNDTALALRVALTVEQTRLILGYVREMLTPAPPFPAAPRVEPLRENVSPAGTAP